MKQHMLTHKIRDMPQHMFGNSAAQSPSSDSGQSFASHATTVQQHVEISQSPLFFEGGKTVLAPAQHQSKSPSHSPEVLKQNHFQSVQNDTIIEPIGMKRTSPRSHQSSPKRIAGKIWQGI